MQAPEHKAGSAADEPTGHPLDRPVWASLLSHHASFSEGGALARRFTPEVHVFASARDESAAALASLAALVRPGERVYLMQVPPIELPKGLVAVKQALGVQMVAKRPIEAPAAHAAAGCACVALGEADAAAMLALARLTEPGPFMPRTHTMGAFFGVKDESGSLLAMAGERLRLPGYTEVSGVCTHPGARGLGHARRLSMAVAAGIQRRGDTPFLHAWESNAAAIALYASLGFELRARVHVAVLERAQAGIA